MKTQTKTQTLTPTYTVLSAIEGGATNIPTLSKILNKHRSTIHETVNKCNTIGLLEKIGKNPITLNLTGKGKIYLMRTEKNINVGFSSLGVRKKKIRLHRLTIKFNLMDCRKENISWDKIVKVKNWSKKFKFIDYKNFKFTIEKTPKSIVLYLSAEINRDLDFYAELTNFILRHVRYADYYLKARGIYFDDLSGEVLHQHLAHDEPSNEMVESKSTVEVDLNRKAGAVFKTKMKAKAWLDWSKSKDKSILDIESNDLTYNEKLVLVPEKVHRIEVIQQNVQVLYDNMAENLKVYNQNILLHISVMKDIKKGVKDLAKATRRLKK